MDARGRAGARARATAGGGGGVEDSLVIPSPTFPFWFSACISGTGSGVSVSVYDHGSTKPLADTSTWGADLLGEIDHDGTPNVDTQVGHGIRNWRSVDMDPFETASWGGFDETVVVSSAKMKYTFCLSNAMLLSVENQGRTFSFNNGPRVVPASDKEVVSENSVRHYLKENAYVIESLANNGLDQYSWKVYPNGMLELDYRYSKKGQFDYLGITFDYPEEKVISKKWLGGGPYRVWKNRMKGTGIGVWDVAYNDAEPGVLWVYPEFKGYFSDMYWVRFVTEEGEMTVYTETEDLFLRVFTPKAGKEPRNTSLAFPAGDISFLHKINGIGAKFKKAEQLGPESQKNNVDGTFSWSLGFIFD